MNRRYAVGGETLEGIYLVELHNCRLFDAGRRD
jgi:hypothetical protein